jgi:methyl-accepting chemotaxis protein
MNLNAMRLTSRLLLAFGVTLLLSLTASGLALRELSQIEANLDDIVTDNNVKITLNYRMADAVHVVVRVIRTMALLNEVEEMKREQEKVAAARSAYDTARAELDKFVPNEAAKARRAAIDQASEKARPLNNQVMELALANKDAEAAAILLKEAGPAAQTWQDAIRANIEAQEQANQAQYLE